MSKNVAVFVDVANIFYAAKAAGTDIDYVTLLQSATAGRDFVRAYAYTGLDPENENQRQFHSFLARNGYKVISKDIRKYGDGRIKANLDIELVVDLMRMATHLDIAVVVSGDGDFAPAIRAVQQMGVRVEVMSFRGNTSSDLIEVADVFTDITQVARVEKGARSGRRVAAAGDLSMTEVPDKQSEGPVRRRRGRRGEEREPVAATSGAAAASENGEGAGMPANLIVLPGERLSRAAGSADEMDAETGDDSSAAGAAGVASSQAADDLGGEQDADGRRRRRRRGGRGRGRSGREEGELEPVGEAGSSPAGAAPEEEEFADEAPAVAPQVSAFGSVWDTQLGVPAAAASPPSTTESGEDEYDDEPEVPEYLLAERRDRGQRGGRGRTSRFPGGAAGGYRQALDRERFGRGGSPYSAPARPVERQRSGGRGVQRDVRQAPRPERDRASSDRPPYERAPAPPRGGNQEPWSEVPFDVQELLLAERTRRRGNGDPGVMPQLEAEPEAGAKGEALSEVPMGPESVVYETTETVAVEPPPASRATRPRSSRSRAAASSADEAPTGAVSETEAETAPSAARTQRRTSRRSAAADATTAEASTPETGSAAGEADAPPTKAAPTRRRTSRRTAATAAEEIPAGEPPAEETAAAPTPRRRTTRRTATADTPEA